MVTLPHRPSFDDIDQLVFECGFGKGFDDVSGRTTLRGKHNIFFARLSCDHQHRDVLELVIGLDLLQQLEPVHVGHVDVADHKVEPAIAQLVERRGTVFGLVCVHVTNFLQQTTDDAAHG